MAAIYTVGQVLPNGATVTADSLTTQPDGTTVELMIATYPSGAVDRTTITTPAAGSPIAVAQTLESKAQAALVNNATYLAIGTPTTAQAIAQVAALTRQVDAVIRMILNQFDTTVGT